MNRAEYLKNWNKQRFEAGICRLYPNKAREGKILCADCASKRKKYEKGWRKKMRSAGLCTLCGEKAPAVEGRRYCVDCLAKCKEQAKASRQRRKENGICPFCPKPSAPGKRLCEEHCEKYRKDNQERRRQRREAGLCENCARPVVVSPDRPKVSQCAVCHMKELATRTLGTARRWEELRDLFERQSVCPYTNIKLEMGVTASLDHIMPLGRGGTNDTANLQFVYCSGAFDVNRMKGEMTDTEFREAIKTLWKNIGSGLRV
jgi:predicted nucleic acid-binding Zn ribbon protein